MRCLPLLTVSSDEPIWVRREVFFAHFDQDDFLCRQTINIAHAYLDDWFQGGEEGANHFVLPAFQIVNGRTQFINGRHRTAVLLEYLEYLPLAYVPRNPEMIRADEAHIDQLRQILHRQLDISEHINLPDLPILESIP